jgi:hypothetical protein
LIGESGHGRRKHDIHCVSRFVLGEAEHGAITRASVCCSIGPRSPTGRVQAGLATGPLRRIRLNKVRGLSVANRSLVDSHPIRTVGVSTLD